MAGCLFIHGIDQVEGVPRVVSLIRFWLDPYGEELGAQVSAAHLIEADVTDVVGIGRANVEAFVEKALGRVGVRVNHESGVVNLLRARAHGNVRGSCRLCSCDEAGQCDGEKQVRDSRHGIIGQDFDCIGSLRG